MANLFCQEHKTALKDHKADIKAILKSALQELAKLGTEPIHEAKEQMHVQYASESLSAVDDTAVMSRMK